MKSGGRVRDETVGTALTTTILTRSRDVRDAMLATGMARGMEQSDARLDAVMSETTDA